jgi:hypothetical protein
MCRYSRISLALLTSIFLSFWGCATPKHTNTLIFGTSTRVAFDVSQDPTGVLGVTLGYKRDEAVWMPLQANQKQGNGKEKLPAADCEKSGDPNQSCKFVGTGSDNGATGGGAVDTYSVLASFGGRFSGNAGNGSQVGAQAGLTQYFATGMAARLLAVVGGASLVNTEGVKPSAEAVQAAVATDPALAAMAKKAVTSRNEAIKTLVNSCSDPSTKKLDVAKWKALLSSPGTIANLKAAYPRLNQKFVDKAKNAATTEEATDQLKTYWEMGLDGLANEKCN